MKQHLVKTTGKLKVIGDSDVEKLCLGSIEACDNMLMGTEINTPSAFLGATREVQTSGRPEVLSHLSMHLKSCDLGCESQMRAGHHTRKK